MLHPIVALLARHPAWLAEHAQAYGELLAEAVARQSDAVTRRTLWWAGACGAACVAAALAGVAVMLWALTPALSVAATWALWGVPAVALAVVLLCAWAAHRTARPNAFDELRAQIAADAALWQSLGAP